MVTIERLKYALNAVNPMVQRYISTTFAHGNGPFSRMVDLVIAYNDLREKQGLERLPAVFPLVPSYRFKDKADGSRQIQFMKETAEEAAGKDFLARHPNELLLDIEQGRILETVFYTGSDFEEALRKFLAGSEQTNEAHRRRIEQGRVVLKNIKGEDVEIDLRDSAIEFGMNNRVATNHPNAFYSNAGAGYFAEVLERATRMPEVSLDKELMRRAIPLAEATSAYQKLHFLTDPGVFSYDPARERRKSTEMFTPPHMHVPKPDSTPLPRDGVYVVLTGIQGLADSGVYDVAAKMGLQVYSGDDAFNAKHNGIKHPPFKIANPRIRVQVARTGWSSVWGVHMLAEHGITMGLLYPPYDSKDDPEILMDNTGVARLGLGVEIDAKNPQQSLERSLELAENNRLFNDFLKRFYGTLDGIQYMAESIVQFENGKSDGTKVKVYPASAHFASLRESLFA